MCKYMISPKSNKRFGEIFSFKMKDTILKGGESTTNFLHSVNVKSKKYGTHFESRIFHLQKIFHSPFPYLPFGFYTNDAMLHSFSTIILYYLYNM